MLIKLFLIFVVLLCLRFPLALVGFFLRLVRPFAMLGIGFAFGAVMGFPSPAALMEGFDSDAFKLSAMEIAHDLQGAVTTYATGLSEGLGQASVGEYLSEQMNELHSRRRT